jgi:hypothetical protein
MAMEMFVLSDRELGSFAEWQAAIDAEGFALKLLHPDFQKLSGFLPTQLYGRRTGFECYHDPSDEFMRENSDIDFGHAWKFVLGFRWIGNFDEFLAAWMAAAAYAVATEGVLFDGEDGSIHSAAEARQIALEHERDVPRLKAELDARRSP